MDTANTQRAQVTPHDHVVFTDLGGGEGVLVDLNSKQYFQLNETATLIWSAIARGTTVPELVQELTNVYDVTPDHAQASVESAIRAFAANRVVRTLP